MDKKILIGVAVLIVLVLILISASNKGGKTKGDESKPIKDEPMPPFKPNQTELQQPEPQDEPGDEPGDEPSDFGLDLSDLTFEKTVTEDLPKEAGVAE